MNMNGHAVWFGGRLATMVAGAFFMQTVAAGGSAVHGNPFVQEIDLQTVGLSTGCHGRFTRTAEGIQIVLPRYDGRTEGQRWPAVNVTLPEDCSAYDRLEYGMFARKGGTFSITFRDKCGHSDFEHKQADAEQKQLPIYTADLSVRGQFDFTKMLHFTIYRSHPGDDAEFLLKSLRLVSSVPERAANMAEAFAALGRSAEAGECRALPDRVTRGELTAKAACAWLDRLQSDYTAFRLADVRARSAVCHPGAAFAVAELDDLERVRPVNDALTAALDVGGWRLDLARREREGLQILVFSPPDRALTNVTIRASAFRDDAGHVLPAAEAAPIGRVTVKSTKGPAHLLGKHFDPICDFTNVVAEVGANRIEAFHVRFRTDVDTPPGTYRGVVSISAEAAGQAEVPVAVVVRNVTLPVEPTIRTATSCYGSKLMGKAIPLFKDWILDEYRINPMSIYTTETPSVEECRAKVSRGMNYIPILYLPNPPDSHFAWHGRKKGFKTPGEYWKALSDEARAHYPPEEVESLLAKLRKAVPAFKEAGLFKYVAAYSFDEYAGSYVPAIGELARAVKLEFPDLRIDSTAVPSEDPRTLGLIEGWIPTTSAYDYRTAERFRRLHGNQVWYYTIYLTVDMDSLADVRAELGTRAFAQRVDGWLVWTVSRWQNSNDAPIRSAGATGWNPESYPGLNGGGSYFCMGPNGRFLPTLRAEAIRDGIEDHCLLSQLKSLDDPRAKTLLDGLDPMRRTYDAATQRLLRRAAFEILETQTRGKCRRTDAEALLARWCDGLVAHQLSYPNDRGLDGAMVCSSCAYLHGRISDTVYPFVVLWDRTGDGKYLTAAQKAIGWCEANTLNADGSYMNDLKTPWNYITVFSQIAIGKTLRAYGSKLPTGFRDRLDRIYARQSRWLFDCFRRPKTATSVEVNYWGNQAEAMAEAGAYLRNPMSLTSHS